MDDNKGTNPKNEKRPYEFDPNGDWRQQWKDLDARLQQEKYDRWKKEGITPIGGWNPKPAPKQWCDSPYTMENGTATFLWIVVMIVGSIFKGNWVIWIIVTVIWSRFITRRKE